AAPFSHAMSPVMKAATASVHRFSDRDICCRSKRRWRAVTGTAPSRVSRTIQTASITRPIPSATHGYAVLSMGERSAEPAHADIGQHPGRPLEDGIDRAASDVPGVDWLELPRERDGGYAR